MDLVQEARTLGCNIMTIDTKEYCHYLCDIQRWLRDRHKIHISLTPIPFNQEDFKWVFKIGLMEISSIPNIARKNSYSILTKENEVYYNSYEESLEHGLFEGLKLIK